MKIIQIASDKQIGIWFYDKQEQELIVISQDTMRNINDISSIPIIGIVVGGGCAIRSLLSWASSLSLNTNYIVIFGAICISKSVSYVYVRQHMKKISLAAKDVGRKYKLDSDILKYITKAGKKEYLIWSMMFIAILIVGFGYFYAFLYMGKREIDVLIMWIFALNLMTMILVTVHPIQKLLFWVRVRKLYNIRRG